jgi:RND superfamily putative drug exporter
VSEFVDHQRPITVRLARWSATHPGRAIALWLVLVTSCVAIGSLVSLRPMSNLDQAVGQSGQAARWIHAAHLGSPDSEDVLITPRSGRLDPGTSGASAAAGQVRQRMAALTQVRRVGAPITAPNGQAVMVEVTLRSGASVNPLLQTTSTIQHTYPNLKVAEVGGTSLNNAVNAQVANDLSTAATFSLPVTLIILLIAFGAIVAAGVPILLALSAVGAATGLSSLVSHVFPDSGSTSSMILLMGMAVGVDYSLFYVKRARSERHRGRTHLDAIEIAAETSGHSVLVSGAAVVVSMLGMFLADDPVFSSLAAGSIVVVAVAVLGSLTVLPAMLVKLGRTIDRPRVPVLWRWTTQTREPRLWPALLRPALARPGRTLAVSTLVLVAVALPTLGLHLESDTARSLPSSIAETQTLNRLAAAFPNQQTTQQVVVRAPAAEASAVAARLTTLSGRLDHNRLFVRGSGGALATSADGTVHVLDVDAPYDAESTPARDGVRALRGGLVADALRGVPGARWAVGGDTATSLDTDVHLSDRLPWVIAFVVGLTMLIMGWVFRSVVIAVTTALVNLLSAGVAFGVLVLTFQGTWAQGLLGFHSTGGLINWIPLFTFAVLFGLSMDYHVFVISRIREEALAGRSTREAIARGITSSAGTVTSAALVMVSVFAIFGSLHMIEMKELGVGLAVAVLVDALIVRTVVLPSLMMLLGRWNWWPGPLSRATDPVAVTDWPELTAVGGR